MNEGKSIKRESKKNYYDLKDDYDYLTSSCSATDCTGLIPANPRTLGNEADPYEEIYPYQPPKMTVKNNTFYNAH